MKFSSVPGQRSFACWDSRSLRSACPQRKRPRHLIGFMVACGLVAIFCVTGCVSLDPGRQAASRDAEVAALQDEIRSLAETVEQEEAWLAAASAHDGARELAAAYRVVEPPWWHNLLVNLRLKQRGLCYHWVEDLLARLNELDLASLEFHWAAAREGTWREHNSVVVTARGQEFAEGIALDAWRHSGHLVWARVSTDRYPWVPSTGMVSP